MVEMAERRAVDRTSQMGSSSDTFRQTTDLRSELHKRRVGLMRVHKSVSRSICIHIYTYEFPSEAIKACFALLTAVSSMLSRN